MASFVGTHDSEVLFKKTTVSPRPMSHPNPPRDTAGGQSHETDGVRRRRAFSFADKKRICEAAMANPRLGCTELANHLGINKYVVRRTLMESEQWLYLDPASQPTSITRRRYVVNS